LIIVTFVDARCQDFFSLFSIFFSALTWPQRR
jgi:hypothetical protein